MRIPGVKSVKALSRWLKARILGGALILGYHRIANLTVDAYDVCVTPEHFAEHMEAISKHAQPISLTELVQHLKTGSLPPKSVAVTFDDGYIDNLLLAKPVLEKYEIPATVFICTGYSGREFWWDELERLVMSSHADLRALRLQVGESQFKWNPSPPSPGAGLPEDTSKRRQFHYELYHFLLHLDGDKQKEAMQIIRNWSGLSTNKPSISRALDHAELLQLADGALIELGAHTRHHPMLPSLSLERQKDEIYSSKRDLEEVLGKQVAGFAYPNGRATVDAKRIVQEAGFAFACTSLHDVVRPGSDLYELTRFWQKDVDGDTFLQGIKLWMRTASAHG